HRKQAADVDRDAHVRPLVLPRGEQKEELEMAGRADRQELGRPLEAGEGKQLLERHEGGPAESGAAESPCRSGGGVLGRIAHPAPVPGSSVASANASLRGSTLTMPRLFHYPLCPFSRRARLALGEYGEPAELIEERPWEHRPQFLQLNPAGTLPVLVEDDRTVIAGIEAIADYLDETRAGGGRRTLFGNTPVVRAEVRRLVAWFDVLFEREVSRNILQEKVDRRFMPPELGGGQPHMPSVRRGLDAIRHHLDYIGQLADERRWLAGDELSHADLAAAAHLSCIDY